MPKILVADDNSNIHRTVALALKEAGVEVIAVGNGEAAVRKIAEVKPDLVLADIFMPVRNGYEVCEFVKQDPRFSQIPVVLLIGAFDPFDEREAQRVQADAILKKPFMPPDSLLRTVADLLAQSASKAAPAPVAAAETHADRRAAPAPAAAESKPQAPEYMDAPPEEFAPAKARLEWDSDDQPVAFGTLLETPGAEENAATDESVMTAHRDPNLGEPAFWAPKAKAEGEEGEAESEEAPADSSIGLGDEEQWRSGGELEELPALMAEAPSGTATAGLLTELPDGAPELPEIELPASEFAETAIKTSQDAAAQLPEFDSFELASPQTAEPLSTTHDSLPELPTFEAKVPVETPEPIQETVPDLKDFAWTTPRDSAEVVQQSQAIPDIDEMPEKEAIEAAAPGLATLAPFLASLTSAASTRGATEPEPFEFDSLPALAEDFHRELVDTQPIEPLDAPAVSQLDPSVIEAIAQRVIERMQPKIIELVTRELLRPAVEALVQRELEKK